MPTRPARYRPPGSKARPPENRPSPCRRGYDRAWQKTRLAFLAGHPLCADCGARGLVVGAEHVDHVLSLAKGGTDDWANLRPLCASCHSRKTVEQDYGLGRAPKK